MKQLFFILAGSIIVLSVEGSPIKNFSDLVRGGHDAATIFQKTFNVPRLVVFKCTMKNCAPCKKIAPEFEAIASKYLTIADFIEVDVHLFDDVIRPFDIKTVPTFIIFNKGHLASSLRGSKMIGEIAKILDAALKKEQAASS
jgi:thioredoxin-like negative regulator of GroEL